MKNRCICTLFVIALFSTNTSAQWVNGQNADFVVGQVNFTDGSYGTSAQQFHTPAAVAIDVSTNKMFVADAGNNRVIQYAYPIQWNNPFPVRIFGQTGSNASLPNGGGFPAANTLSHPTDVSVYAGALWVADAGNNRIVKYWISPATTNSPDADFIIGQIDAASSTSGCTDALMSNPTAIGFEAGTGNLWVADQGNNRVLRFPSAAFWTWGTGSHSADKVLGQHLFTTRSVTGLLPRLNSPSGLALSSTTLWVADKLHDRVLRFDSASSKANGGASDGVLGGVGSGDNQMIDPMHLAVDNAGTLYVCDYTNNRISIFKNAAAKADGASMDYVLGQTSTSDNVSATTQQGLYGPAGVTYDNINGKLLVVDQLNHRVLQYTPSTGLPVEISFFSASGIHSGARLLWHTATEVNNAGFDIERKTQDRWNKVGFVTGHGTSNVPQSYSFIDQFSSGIVRYRLKQIDRDGSYQYSKEVEVGAVDVPNRFTLEQNFPNPFNPSTSISFQLSTADIASLKVYDVLGREAAVLMNERKEAGKNSVRWNAGALPSGVYLYTLQSGRFTETKRMILMK